MKRFIPLVALLLWSCSTAPVLAPAATNAVRMAWPAGLPTYDHIVIVVAENKNYEQIVGSTAAPYINETLKAEGATLTKMYAEEHNSEGNYFWLFSGSNQGVQNDFVPLQPLTSRNLGEQLIGAGRSFKGYSEGLPDIGSNVISSGDYVRRHVPWISFSNVPNGTTVATSSNLRIEDFPMDFHDLPTVAVVIPNLMNDMHDGSIEAGDSWLKSHLNNYYQWAKQNNSLLILTFDEDGNAALFGKLTDPAATNPKDRNRIVTILAGAHIRVGEHDEGKGVTHVNLLRTLEAMYGLAMSGAQQPFAAEAGIQNDLILTDIFEP